MPRSSPRATVAAPGSLRLATAITRSPASHASLNAASSAARRPSSGTGPALVWTVSQTSRTEATAPLVTSTGPSSSSSTETRRRTKSKGISSRFWRGSTGQTASARSVSSSGLAKPVSCAALRKARRSTRSLGRPSASAAPSNVSRPSVSVPVLSEQRTVMLPRFSIEASRRTMVFSAAIREAPCARFTATMAGRSCGVRPMASASENISDSSTGRLK